MSRTVDNRNIRCPRCGAGNFVYATFCVSCGDPIEDDPAFDNIMLITGDTNHVDDARARFAPKAPPPHTDPTTDHRHDRAIYRLRRWEAAAGILLVVCALGYALYSWQKTGSQDDAFRKGTDAAAQRNWDEAARSFALAGDHPDAERMEQEAERQITTRNRLYAIATEAAARSDWATAVDALTTVQEVQPAYRNTVALLGQARTRAFNAGLSGLAYLKDDNSHPGLYVRDAGGHSTYLDGTDSRSVIRAVSGNTIVYDRPSREKDYLGQTPQHNSFVADIYPPAASDRIPVLTHTGTEGNPSSILLPELSGDGTGLLNGDGIWWYSPPSESVNFGFELYYYNPLEGASPGVTRVSDRQSGKNVLAVDLARSRVAITEAVPESESDFSGSRLYIAGANGENMKLIQVVPGTISQAAFSRDGNWLLFSTQQGSVDIQRSVYVMPLNGGRSGDSAFAEAALLQTVAWSSIKMGAHISAAFVPSQNATTRVVVSRIDIEKETITLYDLGTSKEIYTWSDDTDGSVRPDGAGFSDDGSYLALRHQTKSGAFLELFMMQPGIPIVHSSVPIRALNAQVVSMQIAPRSDYVLITVQNPEGLSRGGAEIIYSTRIGPGGVLGGEPKRIISVKKSFDQDLLPVAIPPAGYMLTYVTPAGELHAARLDGSADTVLEENVLGVWSLNTKPDLTWWR